MDWKEIGKGKKSCQDPPFMEAGDWFIFFWHIDNVNNFNVQNQLLGMLIKELNLKGMELELFIYKLNMINEARMNIAEKERKKNA